MTIIRTTLALTHESFRERPDASLQALSDDDLIAYIRAAHRAGRPGAGKRGLAILVYGHWERIRSRVARKVPREEVDDITAAVVESALGAIFQGSSVGELRAFMNRIADRRIADHHRRPRFELQPLPNPDDPDGPFGDEPAEAAETGAVEAGMLVEKLMSELSDDHRQVVQLYCLEQRPASEVAEAVEGMTEANVHQIASRFRGRLRGDLDDGDTSQ